MRSQFNQRAARTSARLVRHAKRRASLALAIAVVAASPQARADNFYDNDGLGLPSGGSGQWSTSLPRWAPDGITPSYSAWINDAATGNVANFVGAGGSTNLVNTASAIQAGGLTLSSSGATYYVTTPAGSGGSFAFGSPGAGAPPIVNVASGSNLIVTGNAASVGTPNTVGLTKTGSGTFDFLGANIVAGGPININAGTVLFGGFAAASATPFGAVSTTVPGTVTIAPGATFATNGNITVGSIASPDPGAGTPGTINLGSIPDNWYLVQPGSSVGQNYLGGAQITAGGDNTSTTYAGVIAGNGGRLTKAGSGSLTLTGDNTFGSAASRYGNTVIGGGTLVLAATDGATLSSTIPVYLANVAGVSLTIANNQTIGSLGGGGTTGGTVNIGANTLTIGTDNLYNNYVGLVTGSGLVVKNGTGLQLINTVSASNSYTGKWKINNGTLAFTGANGFGAATAAPTVDFITLSGGTLAEDTSGGSFNMGANRGITLTANSGINAWQSSLLGGILTIDATSQITGSNQLTKGGSGTLSIRSDNGATYSGKWVMREGALQATGVAPNATPAVSLGTGSIDVSTSSVSIAPALLYQPDNATPAPIDAGANIATGAGSNFTFGPGSSLATNRGVTNSLASPPTVPQTSLTINIGDAAALPATPTLINSGGAGNLLIQVNGDDNVSDLGGLTKIKVNGAVPLTNGIMPGLMAAHGQIPSGSTTIVSGASVADFVTYDATNGVQKFAGYTTGDINTAGATAVYDLTSDQTLTANRSVYALRIGANNINLAGNTLTVGNGVDPAMVAINNFASGAGDALSGGTLAFGASRGVIFANDLAGNMNATMTGSNGVSFIGTNVASSGASSITPNTYNGQGAIYLKAASTYTGPTTIDAAVVKLFGDDQLPTTTDLTIANNGNLLLNGFTQHVHSLQSNNLFSTIDFGSATGTLEIDGTANSTFVGRIGFVQAAATIGTIVQNGAGTLTMGFDNSQTGYRINSAVLQTPNKYVARNGGTISFGQTSAFPAGTDPQFELDNGTFRYTAFNNGGNVNGSTIETVNIGNKSFVLDAGGGTINITNPYTTLNYNTGTEAGGANLPFNIRGSGNLTVTGPGKLIFNEGNSYTGRTIVKGAQISFPTDWQTQGQNGTGLVPPAVYTGNALGAYPASLVADALEFDGGSLFMNGGGANGGFGAGVHYNRGIKIDAGGVNLMINTIYSPISGTGPLIHAFPGVNVTLDDGNAFQPIGSSWSGGTLIQGGGVIFNGASSAGTGPITVDPIYSSTIFKNNGPDTVVPGDVIIKPNAGVTDFFLVSGIMPNSVYVSTTYIAPASIPSNYTIGTMTLNGKVTGAGNWFKGLTGGNNELIVTNSTNDFTGVLGIHNGAVLINADHTLGSTAGQTIISVGGTLALAGGFNYATAEPLLISGAGGAGLNNTGAVNNVSGNNTFSGQVVLTADATVNVSAGSSLKIVNGVVGGPASSLTKSGTGGLAIMNLRTGGGLTINAGTLSISPDSTAAGTSKFGPLAITAGSQLDLTNNKVITSSAVGTWTGTAYDGVTGLIQTGRNGGGWGGSGIVTSQSQAATGNLTTIGVATASQVKGIAATATATFAGQTVTGSDTLVMYTYGGDANLDGKINVDDYTRIDFNVPLGSSGWYNGDFNYDGKINVDDYTIIDFNVGIQGAPFATTGSPGSVNGISAVTAVPEPAGLALLSLAALSAGRRRRRN